MCNAGGRAYPGDNDEEIVEAEPSSHEYPVVEADEDAESCGNEEQRRDGPDDGRKRGRGVVVWLGPGQNHGEGNVEHDAGTSMLIVPDGGAGGGRSRLRSAVEVEVVSRGPKETVAAVRRTSGTGISSRRRLDC